MAIKRYIPGLEKFQVTVYPYTLEKNGEKSFQAAILTEELPGIVEWDYIYSSGSIEGLVGKLTLWKNSWKPLLEKPKSYSISVIQRYPGFEKIFWPRHSLVGLKSDMGEAEYNRFLEEFKRKAKT